MNSVRASLLGRNPDRWLKRDMLPPDPLTSDPWYHTCPECGNNEECVVKCYAMSWEYVPGEIDPPKDRHRCTKCRHVFYAPHLAGPDEGAVGTISTVGVGAPKVSQRSPNDQRSDVHNHECGA